MRRATYLGAVASDAKQVRRPGLEDVQAHPDLVAKRLHKRPGAGSVEGAQGVLVAPHGAQADVPIIPELEPRELRANLSLEGAAAGVKDTRPVVPLQAPDYLPAPLRSLG